ncbi:Protein of unknown function [Propionibacterium freudenreichii]|nr:Protein of unknown function [Propionibacterium freudenreichii]
MATKTVFSPHTRG